MNDIPWGSYKIVGFSSMFQQQIASLSLARRLKQAFPDLFIIFGGANCEGAMGSTLLKSFPFIDAVCSGEGDVAFPLLIQQLVGKEKPRHIAGILRRDATSNGHRSLPLYNIAGFHQAGRNGGAEDSPASSNACAPDETTALITQIDELPYPQFKDYFDQVEKSDIAPEFTINLPFETSRGCWRGERHHCTFCGLNGTSMKFRYKSPRH